EITEPKQKYEIIFKGENGYRAGFEAKNFCLGRKMLQESKKGYSVDLLLYGVSEQYQKSKKISLLDLSIYVPNIYSWQDQIFYDSCEPLPHELREREQKIMQLLRGDKAEDYW